MSSRISPPVVHRSRARLFRRILRCLFGSRFESTCEIVAVIEASSRGLTVPGGLNVLGSVPTANGKISHTYGVEMTIPTLPPPSSLYLISFSAWVHTTHLQCILAHVFNDIKSSFRAKPAPRNTEGHELSWKDRHLDCNVVVTPSRCQGS